MKISSTIQIVSAPSILGLQSEGVDKLPERLLSHGLTEKLKSVDPVINVPTHNRIRSPHRDPESQLLNKTQLQEFSTLLYGSILKVLEENKFPLVLGGDCSILVGIMAALKSRGTYGLIFQDAHADYYLPEESITGEAADTDLALVTGRGPDSLTNLFNLKPYVAAEHVFHLGQRDADEIEKFGSYPIRKTAIRCFDAEQIHSSGTKEIADHVISDANRLKPEGYWIHFDTDVLSDDTNPAVDYRLPGGLSFDQVEYLMHRFLNSLPVIGLSVTIYNPLLDPKGIISSRITACLVNAFS
jgi:arginase